MRRDLYLLRAVVAILFFVLNLFAVFLMLRGHNLPGGGFIGGLASAISAVLAHMAFSPEEIRRWLKIDPLKIAVAGLLFATATAAAPMLAGWNFFTHTSWHFHVPLLGELHIGTPLFFDFGVYLVVVGISTKIIYTLANSVLGERTSFLGQMHGYTSVLEQPIEKLEVADAD